MLASESNTGSYCGWEGVKITLDFIVLRKFTRHRLITIHLAVTYLDNMMLLVEVGQLERLTPVEGVVLLWQLDILIAQLQYLNVGLERGLLQRFALCQQQRTNAAHSVLHAGQTSGRYRAPSRILLMVNVQDANRVVL